MGQFHWDPAAYLELMRQEVPDYEALRDALVEASHGGKVGVILELGAGSGETTRRLLDAHPGARVVGLDASPDMLEAARSLLAGRPVELHERRLEDRLPAVPYDLVASVLALRHLDAPGKAELVARVAAVLRPGGRLVLADVVVPDDPADAVTPIDGNYDTPSRVEETARLAGRCWPRPPVSWARRDLAFLWRSARRDRRRSAFECSARAARKSDTAARRLGVRAPALSFAHCGSLAGVSATPASVR